MISLILGLLLLTSCNVQRRYFVEFGTHKLKTYTYQNNTEYLIVFESGLGDDHSIWQTQNFAKKISQKMDVILYDRGGYGKSTIDNNPRNIARLRVELETVINKFSSNRKVILVGHSLGGLIIRDYAIKNPEKTAALLFVDPSHEHYNQFTQEIEDIIYKSISNDKGSNFGGAKEAKMLIEDFEYISLLPNLPNIPVVVLTSMKTDESNTSADKALNKSRQDLYNAHELLKAGVQDFTHITTINSGHYIMKEEPTLLIENINLLISKLP